MDRKLKIGDTVKVKNGTTDSEFGIDIGGWHGQILQIVNDQAVINWDSITLSNIPDEYIFQCEQEGLDWGAFNAWEKYLTENLSFPFDAEICEYQDSGLLKQGDKIRIHGITGNEDPYGVIAKIKLGRKVFHFPLCDIEALDKTSANGQLLNTYRDWFGNR